MSCQKLEIEDSWRQSCVNPGKSSSATLQDPLGRIVEFARFAVRTKTREEESEQYFFIPIRQPISKTKTSERGRCENKEQNDKM